MNASTPGHALVEEPRPPSDPDQTASDFRTLFDLSPVAVYSINGAGVVQEFNQIAAELWGRSPKRGDTDEVFCGSHRLFLPDGTFLAHRDCPMATVLHGDISEVRNTEVIIERPDGSRVDVIVNIRPLKNAQGTIVGAINCFYDITERKRLERKTQQQAADLIQLHKRKDEFLAMLSHELRGPLAPIFSAVQLLQRGVDTVPRIRLEGIIENSARQLKHLLDDLMDVSRITHGKVQLQLKPTTMASVVQRAVDTARPLMDKRKHAFEVVLSDEPMVVLADQSRLEQVILNLLTNAAKYTLPGGRIWLTAQQEGEQVVLRIRDTGMGISPSDLPNVFDLFSQAETSNDRTGGGLGIGLCLVQGLIELHGGAVSASSELNVGSEFTVRLPLMVGASMTLIPDRRRADEGARDGRRVLVVDDNIESATILSELLDASGFSTRLAHDGQAALKAVAHFKPHIVLLDVGLPLINGHDVARAIRADVSIIQPVLFAITGYSQDRDRCGSKDAGFDFHLVKPVDFDELMSIVSGIRLLPVPLETS